MSRVPRAIGSIALVLSLSLAAQAQTETLPEDWIDISATSPTMSEVVVDAQRAASRDDLWIGYTFALREGVHIGCDDWRGSSVSFGRGELRFHIERDDNTWSASCDQDFGLFLRFEGDASSVVEARMMLLRRAAARLDGAVVWAGDMSAGDSVRWLRSAVLDSGSSELRAAGDDTDRIRRRLLNALAVHASPAAVDVLFASLDSQHPSRLRESAVFWAAQLGGNEGLQRLIGLAREDGDKKVRQQSVFWLAQVAGERATEHLTEIAENDPDTEVRTAAVFALSQSEDDAAVDALIEIVRTHDNREVVKSALFWLGQSGDPRAVALIEELLFGRTR